MCERDKDKVEITHLHLEQKITCDPILEIRFSILPILILFNKNNIYSLSCFQNLMTLYRLPCCLLRKFISEKSTVRNYSNFEIKDFDLLGK